MAWMNLSPLTPVALTTPRFLRWCSDSRWTTGSTTPSAAWWVCFRSLSHEWQWVLFSQLLSSSTLCVCLCGVGMVQSGPGVCLGWILRKERSSGLSQTPVLPAWSPGKGRKWGHYRPHTSSLQLRFLCLSCPWEQVCAKSFFMKHYDIYKHIYILWLSTFICNKLHFVRQSYASYGCSSWEI